MPANDGTRDGWFLLLEPKQERVLATWHRLKIDALQAAEAMRKAGLGAPYREALVSGLWPSMDVLPEAERLDRGIPLQPEPLLLR